MPEFSFDVWNDGILGMNRDALCDVTDEKIAVLMMDTIQPYGDSM